MSTNFEKLGEKNKPHYQSLWIDKYFPSKVRQILRKTVGVIAILTFALSFGILPIDFGQSDGFFFLLVFVYLSLSFLEFFYRSMKHEGLTSRIDEKILDKNKRLDYSLSELLFETDEIDATRALFESKIGFQILIRCGILPTDFKSFVFSDRSPVIFSSLTFSGESQLKDYLETLYDNDKSLENFLSKNSINKKEFLGAAEWVTDTEQRKLRRERFWSRENLGIIPSIGKSWSFGIASDLGKFGTPFENNINLNQISIENGYRNKEVALLESILERNRQANAIIIEDDPGISKDIVSRLLKKVKLGITYPTIEHKNIISLGWNDLMSAYKNKNELESEIIKIFSQSISAKNVILFIDDFPGFLSSLQTLGISSSLISPYLDSYDLQLIATSNNPDFHFFIENNPAILEKFERIIPDKVTKEASYAALLEQVPALEAQYGLIFSFASILSLVDAAQRYIMYGEMPSKAIDLILEIAPWAKKKNVVLIREGDVSNFISEKTGITTGPIKDEERSKINDLEQILKKRIVGQEEAVKSIAAAIRRARSGVQTNMRPLVSLLFLGPTGVGKTEVAKALSETFFGVSASGDEKMIRLDMSEFSGPDALSRLIGDFASNKSGILASKVRDNPFSVLLLDEFEKAFPDILDLFLQILDEGEFNDSFGKQVNCRNLIIIATSNAASSLIWETVKSAKSLVESKDYIVDSIIKDKVFKIELLNRFDGIILFNPLGGEELERVSRLQIEKLKTRLKEQDIELMVEDEAISLLSHEAKDSAFGGREINRIIKNKIENLIAEKIVNGELKPGSSIKIKKEDLS